MEHVTSRANPLIGHIRKLNASRAYRRETGEYCCEGPKLLDEALRWGARVTAVITDGRAPLPSGLPAHARQVTVPADLLRAAAATESPQGVLFLCAMPSLAPPDVLTGAHYLVLDGLQDPGNVGTVWRTADAFGADGLFLLRRCADPFSPKTVRATMGAVFRLPVWETDLPGLKRLLDLASIPLCAAALHQDAEDVRTAPLTPAAVLIGSEGRGVSPEALTCSDRLLKIPMRDRCESLNAAVAASVVLWEMMRRS